MIQRDPSFDGVPIAAVNGTLGSVSGVLLLVEPDAGLRGALELHLTRLGLQIVKAVTGQAALDLLKSEQPSFLMSHAYLPDMGSEDLMRLTRTVSPDTAIIIMGDGADRKAAISALRLYATNYIPIPVESEFLEVALARAAQWRNIRITMRRQAEQLDALHQTKVLFQQLFDEVPCYISIQDKNFRLTGANRRFKEDFGDGIGSICYRLYKHRDEPCRDCPVLDTFADGQLHHTEEILTTQSGNKINVLTWTAPIRDASGNITQVMEMATDISQIRKLQSRLTSIGLLMGSLSHSIKGTLTALDGGVYRLESGLEKDDAQRVNDGVSVIKDMVHRIRKMVLNVLYYTKGRELNWGRIRVKDFTQEILSVVMPKAAAAGVRLEFRGDGAAGAFEIDPSTMRSALVNILENCIDACVDDPSEEKAHRVSFSVRDEGAHVVYEIADNGVGMHQETMEKMFTLFFSSKGSRGTGLGMFIAHQIIEQHAGGIDVTSAPGEGSLFRVRLPRTLPAEVKKKNPADSEPAAVVSQD